MKRRSRSSWFLFALGLACGLGIGWALAPRQQVIPPMPPPAAPIVVAPPRVSPIAVAPGTATPLYKLISEQGVLLAERVDRAEFERQHARRLEEYRENPAALVELHLARASAMHFTYSDDASSLTSLVLARDIGELLWHRTILRRMGAACDMGRILLNEKRLAEAHAVFRYAELVFEELELSSPRPIPETDSLSRYDLYSRTINGLFDTMTPEAAAKQPVYWGGWLSVRQRGDRAGALVIHPGQRRCFDAIRVLQSEADESVDWTDADKAAALRAAELLKESLVAASARWKDYSESMRRRNYEIDPKTGDWREVGGENPALEQEKFDKFLLDYAKKTLEDHKPKDNKPRS